MDYVDTFHPTYENDNISESGKQLNNFKKTDSGFNKVKRMMPKSDGTLRNKNVEIYTTSNTGKHIRDAESGNYYNHIVGTLDEDLYFKVTISTGECRNKNGSNTLFYTSPQHFMRHMNYHVDQNTITSWESKRNARLRATEKSKK